MSHFVEFSFVVTFLLPLFYTHNVHSSSDAFPHCPIPVDCTAVYDPVCGTDGKTYYSSCIIRSVLCANVTIAYQGACSDDVTEESYIDATDK
ncbi:hypothetical protein BsWGS_13102 [Bradybaena similaris]